MKTIGELDTRNPDCNRCGGSGWVCEKHQRKPWSDGPDYDASRGLGCACGAGVPCPKFNDLATYGKVA